jgi:hypothetical protein
VRPTSKLCTKSSAEPDHIDRSGTNPSRLVRRPPSGKPDIASTRMQAVSELCGRLQQYVKNASRSPFQEHDAPHDGSSW